MRSSNTDNNMEMVEMASTPRVYENDTGPLNWKYEFTEPSYPKNWRHLHGIINEVIDSSPAENWIDEIFNRINMRSSNTDNNMEMVEMASTPRVHPNDTGPLNWKYEFTGPSYPKNWRHLHGIINEVIDSSAAENWIDEIFNRINIRPSNTDNK